MTNRTIKCMPFLFGCINLFAAVTSNTIGSSSQGPYTSIKALDKFGNSVQLRNAKLSSKHSSLVLAAKIVPSGSVLVCTVQNSSPGLKRQSPNTIAGNVVHVIGMDEDVATNERGRVVAMVCSGIKADAILLQALLREQSRRVWERYGTTMTVCRLAYSISEVLLTFMGYDRTREISDGTGPVVADREFKMARPFGVDSLAIEVEGDKGRNGTSSILSIIHVDAAGVQRDCNTKALGRGSVEAEKLLQERWTSDMNCNDVKLLFSEIFKEILFGRQRQNNDNDEVPTNLSFDILNVEGIQSTLDTLVA